MNRSAAIYRSISFVAVYFLSNFLAVPLAIQDMILQVVSTAMMGYTVLLHLQLYIIYPVLVMVPLLLLATIVHFVVQSMRVQEILNRRKLMYELKAGSEDMNESPDKPAGEIRQRTLSVDSRSSASSASSYSSVRQEADDGADTEEDSFAMEFWYGLHSSTSDDDESNGHVARTQTKTIGDAPMNAKITTKISTNNNACMNTKASSQPRDVELVSRVPHHHVTRKESVRDGLDFMRRLVHAIDVAPDDQNCNDDNIGKINRNTRSIYSRYQYLPGATKPFDASIIRDAYIEESVDEEIDDDSDEEEEVWLHNLHLSPSLSTSSSSQLRRMMMSQDEEEVDEESSSLAWSEPESQFGEEKEGEEEV